MSREVVKLLVSGKELFQAAKKGGYAVGAFNLNNMGDSPGHY